MHPARTHKCKQNPHKDENHSNAAELQGVHRSEKEGTMRIVTIVAILLIAGCTTQPDTGSKADEVFDVSYQYDVSDDPAERMMGSIAAITRCERLRNGSVPVPVGEEVKQCQKRDAEGVCISVLATARFQCQRPR